MPLTISASNGVPNGAPAGPAKLTAGLTSKRHTKAVAAYGRKVTVSGRLRAADGKTPIVGARVQVLTHKEGAKTYKLLREVATDKAGRYQTTLPAGTSRRVRVTYRALTLQPTPTAARSLRLQTRAGVSLQVKLRGRVVRMSGAVLGGSFPRGGVLVSLQGRQAGDRWRPFKTVRAKGKHQRFGGSYRFGGGGRFKLRAVVNEQSGYPYTRGTSRSRSVRVR